jgi:hypothetical protein
MFGVLIFFVLGIFLVKAAWKVPDKLRQLDNAKGHSV